MTTINVDSKQLRKALDVAKSVTVVNPAKPILEYCVFNVKNRVLYVQANNLDVVVSVKVCELDASDCQFLFPVRRFKLPGKGSVQFQHAQCPARDTLTVLVGNTKTELDVPKVEDYPPILEASSDSGSHWKVSAGDLIDILEKTRYAIDKRAEQFNLACVLLEFHPDCVVGVSTNAARLALAVTQASSFNVSNQQDALIHRDYVPTLLKFLSMLSREENVIVYTSDDKLCLKSSGSICTIRQFDAKFPNWRNAFPEKTPTAVVRMDAKSAAEALTRVALDIRQCEKHPGTTFTVSENTIKLTTEHPKLGKSEETVQIIYVGNPFQVILNPAYVIDFLKRVDTESVNMYYYDHNSPVMFKDGTGYTYLVMPKIRS